MSLPINRRKQKKWLLSEGKHVKSAGCGLPVGEPETARSVGSPDAFLYGSSEKESAEGVREPRPHAGTLGFESSLPMSAKLLQPNAVINCCVVLNVESSCWVRRDRGRNRGPKKRTGTEEHFGRG